MHLNFWPALCWHPLGLLLQMAHVSPGTQHNPAQQIVARLTVGERCHACFTVNRSMPACLPLRQAQAAVLHPAPTMTLTWNSRGPASCQD